MPEMDGLEATRQIRDGKSAVRNHSIPVVAMTASAMKEDRDNCLKAGMNDYISKPVNPADLARVLKQYSDMQIDEKVNPAAADAPQTTRAFDKSELLERVGGDAEICAEILKVFIDDIPVRIQEMEDALQRQDYETLKRGAHTIKGSSGNVGALKLQEAAYQLETSAAAGEMASAREKLDAIITEFKKVYKAIGEGHG